MDNREIAQEWFELADYDLQSAVFLLKMKPKPLEIMAYHCQQSVEKYLKGFLAFHGGQIKKTHDLIFLNKECQKYDALFKNIIDECINLTDYGVQVRYPFHIDIEEEDLNWL
ncbi:HEPN domain-containing protein [Halocella sp. SP3-1]|uniref:HEPN domain-containing protein n=1 Tax=Halocella sp. SP3-1 TaxID=2382161 RepID=UPI00197B011B|nr:HEPN domain-containing protein [Halocella sp. SP3-1]